MPLKRESHRQALRQLVEWFIGTASSDAFKDKLVDKILLIHEGFALPDRHVSSVINDAESFRRGGSTRIAACTCGWIGPQRSTMELAADDAIEHEKESYGTP